MNSSENVKHYSFLPPLDNLHHHQQGYPNASEILSTQGSGGGCAKRVGTEAMSWCWSRTEKIQEVGQDDSSWPRDCWHEISTTSCNSAARVGGELPKSQPETTIRVYRLAKGMCLHGSIPHSHWPCRTQMLHLTVFKSPYLALQSWDHFGKWMPEQWWLDWEMFSRDSFEGPTWKGLGRWSGSSSEPENSVSEDSWARPQQDYNTSWPAASVLSKILSVTLITVQGIRCWSWRTSLIENHSAYQ